jgi:hypothetical protein
MIKRLLLAGVFAAAGPALAWAEPSCKFTEADIRSVKVPEQFRADYLRKLESDCEIGKLQPLLIEIGLAVLHDVKELEMRPRGQIEAWAEPLRRLHGPGNEGYGPLFERLDRIRGMVRPGALSNEEEVRRGNVGRRLIQLAVSGRVTKREYDSLLRRLQGN